MSNELMIAYHIYDYGNHIVLYNFNYVATCRQPPVAIQCGIVI